MDISNNKKSMKRWYYLILLILLAINCTNCSDDDNTQNPKLEFHTFLPKSGGKGTKMAIAGNNFGEDISSVKVWINNQEVAVTKVTNTRIFFDIPSKCGSGSVRVQVGEMEYTYSEEFTYMFGGIVVDTYAGNGTATSTEGALLEAGIPNPIWLAYDKKEDALFVLEATGSKYLTRIKNGQVEHLASLDFGDATTGRAIEFSITGDSLFVSCDWNAGGVKLLKRSDNFSTVKDMVSLANVSHCCVNPIDGSIWIIRRNNLLYNWDPTTGITAESTYEIHQEGFNYEDWNSEDGLRFTDDGKELYLIHK